MFPFSLLSPKRWIESILGTILIIALVLIPGWKTIFSQKTVKQSWQIFSSNPLGTITKSTQVSFYYYRSLVKKETKKQLENLQKEVQKEVIKTLEEKSGIKTK